MFDVFESSLLCSPQRRFFDKKYMILFFRILSNKKFKEYHLCKMEIFCNIIRQVLKTEQD